MTLKIAICRSIGRSSPSLPNHYIMLGIYASSDSTPFDREISYCGLHSIAPGVAVQPALVPALSYYHH